MKLLDIMPEDQEQRELSMEKAEGPSKAEVEAGVCFVCQGVGHWARECTSLPGIYLTEDAPRCYRCNGVGHFARFCPNSEKQWRFRERRASLPLAFTDQLSWGAYFDDLGGGVPFPEQMLFVRPEYPSSDSFSSFSADAPDSDDSAVEYVIEDQESIVNGIIPITRIMVDTAIESTIAQ